MTRRADVFRLVKRAAELRADEHALSPAERGLLESLGLGDGRRVEWIRGRRLAREAIAAWRGGAFVARAHILADAGGAPRIVPGIDGSDALISLAHDPEWVAVLLARRTASRPGPIGIDLCAASRSKKAAAVLAAAGVHCQGLPACAAWAIVEAALKAHNGSIVDLVASPPLLRPVFRRDAVEVHGLAARPLRVAWELTPDYALAWATS